jgi:hypothetical protein
VSEAPGPPPDGRDWLAEIARWEARFASAERPPEPFATARREGWAPGAREILAMEAAEYARTTAAYLDQLRAAGVDLVRFDCKLGSCEVCEPYEGSAYSLRGETPELPPPPPLPICPACRHTLNMLTPFFMQRSGLELEDLAERAVPFEQPDPPGPGDHST